MGKIADLTTLQANLKDLKKLMDTIEKLEAKIKPFKDAENLLREDLLNSFKHAELNGATGSGLRLSIAKSTVPTLKDAKKFFQFASKPANWDLLQKNVNSGAWRERLNEGKTVPGVETYSRISLRINKVTQ